ncbi:MAG TPA: multiheme c-type cytochrome, partial [Pirellulales bacterium]|nr:multiheme c-type cytochrome [Pirellulales bacterium]
MNHRTPYIVVAMLLLATGSHADESPEVVAPHVARPWVGVSSCSAQPCHGDVARDQVWPIWGNEVTVWLERDRHAQAYRVLSNELSKKMAERLQLGVPANRSAKCLGCHSPADFGASAAEPFLADGVGCESCHGPAEQWLAKHTLQGWRDKPSRAKRELGLVDTNDLHDRAKACAVCHVGSAAADSSPGGEVNHDLIAAGHPALKFEFTAYLAKMPKHWTEKSSGAGFEAR